MAVVEGVVHVGGGADDDADETAGDGDGQPNSDVPRFADVDAFVAELGRVGDEHGVAVQAFDARLVVDRAHLESAVAHADRSFERGENVARDRAVEVLCYAAGRRQIDRALAMGVGEGATPAVLVVHDAGGEHDPDGSETTPAETAAVEAVADLLEPADPLGVATDEAAIREFFDVSDAELATTEADLSALVRERVALLDVEK